MAEGNVLFSVPSMSDYGQLSRRPLDEMVAGARVEVAPYKRGDLDFVLWKPSAPEEPGWDSPWGRGRPGWHIECSAMSWHYLGETFDIHGGGIDLVFPHHENEIAQTRCTFGHSMMAQVWMHNGFLQVEGEKMSKSVGNFITIRDALADWPSEAIRLNMLKTHYRQPIDWTKASMRESQRELDRWYPVASQYAASAAMLPPDFIAALEDDLNTPEAVTVLRRLYAEALDGVALAGTRLASAGRFLGLFERTLPEWIGWRPASAGIDELFVHRLIEARTAARKAKDFAEIRSHPRRTRRTRRRPQGREGRHDDMDGEAMSPQSADSVALRPFLPADGARCVAIFRDSIEALTGEDYDDDQRAAWIAAADDPIAFGRRLSQALTLVATVRGEVAGFASLEGADVIDMLYVAPHFARRSIGTLLLDALSKLAAARGAGQLTAEVSDTARPLFERQGFSAVRRNMVQLDGEWFGNTTMTKPLAGSAATPPQTH